MSLSKARLKFLRSLMQKKTREEERKFLIEGARMVSDSVDSGYKILEVYHTRSFAESAAGKELVERLGERTSGIAEVSEREMDQICDTVSSQGIVAVLKQKEFSLESMFGPSEGKSHLVALDAVSDPGNAGTMLRTCDWFGIDGVMFGNNSVDLYNPKLLRSTMGGIFHMPVIEGVDLLSTLSRAKELGYTVIVTDQSGETHFDRITWPARSLIVFGNEAWGVSDQVKELADIRVSIRRYGLGDSLNVSVACGIVLSSVHRLYE